MIDSALSQSPAILNHRTNMVVCHAYNSIAMIPPVCSCLYFPLESLVSAGMAYGLFPDKPQRKLQFA